MKKVYIMHQYYEKSHFKALYEAGVSNGYYCKRFIILDNNAFIRQIIKSIFKKKDIREAITIITDRLFGLYELKRKKNQNLIVGLAPYDHLLNKYSKIINQHHSIYFTSSTIWNSSSYFERGSIKNKASFLKLLRENFDALACVSNETKNQIGNYFAKTQVVAHSIEVEKYKKKLMKNEHIKFLYLGQINERKNIPLMIQWIESNPNNFGFDFIGPLLKNEPDISKKLLELEKKDNRVNYLGVYSKSRIMSEIQNYDFLVLPSLEEKFGIVLIEALSANVPCIVSNTFGPKEIIENGRNGFIFDLSDPNDFSEKMTKALEIDFESYNEMMLYAGERAKDFDVNNIFEKWLKLLI